MNIIKKIMIVLMALIVMNIHSVIAEPTTIKYQVESNYSPFRYIHDNGNTHNRIEGFEIELNSLIFDSEDYHINYSADNWDAVYRRVANGEVDTCGLIVANEDRKKDILFSKPLFQSYIAIYTKNAVGKISMQDLDKYRVAVGKNQYTETILRNKVGVKHYLTFETVEDAINAVYRGEADILFENQQVVNFFLIKNGLRGDIVARKVDLFPVDVVYGVRKDNPQLVSYLNKRISRVQRSGAFEELYIKNFNMPSSYYKIMHTKKMIIWAISILLFLLVVFILLRVYIKHLKNRLMHEQYFSESIVNNANSAIIVWKTDGTIIKFNRFAEEITGFHQCDLLEKSLIETIIPQENRLEVCNLLNDLKNNHEKGKKVTNYESPLLCKNGQRVEIFWNNSALYNENGKPDFIVSMRVDVTERKRAENKIYKLAYYDSLTGLPNRTRFEDKVKEALEENSKNGDKFAILFLDLDNFKTINDSFGHAIGDTLLIEVANTLRNYPRDGFFVTRFGIDEFAILISKFKDICEIREIAEEIIQIFRKPIILETREFYNTVSIGIAVYPNDGLDIYTLIKNADAAMYKVKERGKDNYEFYTPAINDELSKKLDLERDLRHAIENEEFEVFYQPKIELKTNRIIGVEALIRWNHPNKGLISPAEFIPIAEESGLIIPIGEWVMRTACSQIKKWNNSRLQPLIVSVNLSARQFQKADLKDIVQNVLSESGIDASMLEIEITESIAMKDIDVAIRLLKELRQIGIKVSLDDFGIGYSSLNYLRRLPIDILKIDKSFVDDITEDSDKKVIAETIIALAHKMGLVVVAEGVEMKEQLAFLRKQQCDIVQGYLFSKPLKKKDVESFILQR